MHHRFFAWECHKINQKNEHCSNKMILFVPRKGVKLRLGRRGFPVLCVMTRRTNKSVQTLLAWTIRCSFSRSRREDAMIARGFDTDATVMTHLT